MSKSPLRIFVTLVVCVAVAPVGTPVVNAQSQRACDAAIEKLDRDTRKLSSDLDADVREFIHNDAVETSLAGIRNHFKNQPASEAVFDLREKWNSFNDYAEYIKNARVTMEDLTRCINTRGCSLMEFAKRQNEAIAKWIQSLGNDALNAAAERANKAAKVLRNYSDRTLAIATNGTLDTVNKCVTRFEQQAQTSNTSSPTTSLMTPPTSGGGGGKTALKVIGVGVAGVGMYVGLQTLNDAAEDLGNSLRGDSTNTGGATNTTGGGSSSSNATYRATATRSCQVGAVNTNPLNPGFLEPCFQATAGGACGPTDFTITVTGSTARDCGGWLFNATVSNGFLTGRYDGVCGSGGINVSGSLGGVISGTGVCRGNTYTVSIATTRQ